MTFTSMAFMTTITKLLRPRASANAVALTHTKALKVINTKTVTLQSEDQKALLGYVLVTNWGELAAKDDLSDETSREIETEQVSISALSKMALALRPPMGREDEIYKAGHIQFDNNVRTFAQDAFKEIGIKDISLRD